MNPLSPQDKTNLASIISASAAGLANQQAVLKMVKDDGLRKIIENGMQASQAQMKSVQEFCKSHNIS